MLKHHNLQFTNATKFNDPFDCHPALFDYSNVPPTPNNWPPTHFVSLMEENHMENLRNDTWICCLSKVYNSLLMWSYYNSHKGICIGLNKDVVLKSCRNTYFGFIFPFAADIKYKDLLPKPNYFRDYHSWDDLLTTKAKAWEHEQEVRIIAKEPAWVHAGQDVPSEFNEEAIIDGKEIRHYPIITSDCFESVYLGVNMLPRNKTKIINAAKKLNPKIKIFQMTIDSTVFKLKKQPIEESYGQTK